jgi:polyhydroxyalkanoate synthesis regulator phasin
VSYLKAIDRILWLAYGNHPQTSEYREKAEKIIDYLRRDQHVEKSELMEFVDLDPDVESDDRKFKRILQPLKGDKSGNPMDITFVTSFQKGDDRFYRLSRDSFDASVKNIVRNIRYAIDTEPDSEIIELREEASELRDRVSELEEENERLRESTDSMASEF